MVKSGPQLAWRKQIDDTGICVHIQLGTVNYWQAVGLGDMGESFVNGEDVERPPQSVFVGLGTNVRY